MNRTRILAYLQLMRLSNVFTAIADIVMGFVFVNQSLNPIGTFLLLCVASGLLYTSGMVLNDVFDVEKDTAERNERPIPSGKISLLVARRLGFGLMICGLIFASIACFFAGGTREMGILNFRIPIIAVVLAFAILAYDWWLKKTPLSPIAMGSCRFFNVLLGMSGAAAFEGDNFLGFGLGHVLAAGGIGIYISGVTLFARTEAKVSNRGMLVSALAVMIGGLVMLASLAFINQSDLPFQLTRSSTTMWPLLLMLVSVTVIRVCLTAVYNPIPKRVQQAIKQSILTLIFLDAAVCLLVAPNRPQYAVGVLALLVPMLWLGRYIRST